MNGGASNVGIAWIACVCDPAPGSYNSPFLWSGS